jgi:outer membrane immunogenic protein
MRLVRETRFMTTNMWRNSSMEMPILSMTRFVARHMNRLLAAVSAFAVLAAASQASAADLAARSAPVYSKAPEYAAVSNWTGWYIGGNVGYGWGPDNSNVGAFFKPVPGGFTNTFTSGNDVPTKAKGVIGGAQFGYNWQAGSFVTGFEMDFQGAGIDGQANSSSFTLGNGGGDTSDRLSASQSLSWFGTVRARVGMTVTPDFLLYGTGGLAYGEVKDSGAFTHVPTPSITNSVDVTSTRVGWAAGVGAEWKFARNWSAKMEYLHADLGSVSATGVAIPSLNLFPVATWHNQFDTVRTGVNYHFN